MPLDEENLINFKKANLKQIKTRMNQTPTVQEKFQKVSILQLVAYWNSFFKTNKKSFDIL